MLGHYNLSKSKAVIIGIALAVAGGLVVSSANSATIIDEWASVKAPPPPELKPVTIDPGSTALLMLDFLHQNCNDERRPRCVASLPQMKKLLSEARAAGVMVVYSVTSNAKVTDIWEDIAPKGDEPWVKASVDKFIGTDLEKILADKGIRTVITVGTAAQGAVLYTASAAALRGLQVIVPVDGVSAEDTYFEQYVVYDLSKAPGVSGKVTLTTVDMMTF
jgi:nicotinamidase-related amidase